MRAQSPDVLEARLQRFLQINDDRACCDQAWLIVGEAETRKCADGKVSFECRERGGRIERPIRSRDAAFRQVHARRRSDNAGE